MSTLSQIIGNVIMGSIVTTGSFCAFGAAVRFGWNSNLTPRAWSRPKAVLKNVLHGPWYGVSWIGWAMRQQYSDLLAGIPGTGTRMDGWSGPTLKTNLDTVILLRFHMMQLKVSAVATVLMMFVLMPLYKSASCDPQTLGLQTCLNQQNLTDFEQLTIANVPAYSFSPLLNGTTAITLNGTTTIIIGQRENPLNGLLWVPGLTGRYIAPVIVMFIITVYSCYLLWHEWVECLALRRVYYLESSYFMERIEELDELKTNTDPEDPFQKDRPPFLPHPEMRETIPNISLNSVLYQLPNSLKEYRGGTGGTDDGKNLLERQLDATVNFFDQCVPNQPGFTSSVVAVTIVPDAALVKGAWMKWYACGKKLRRLRYIKHVLARRKEMQAEGIRGIHDYVDTAIKAPVQVAKFTGKAASGMVNATGNAVTNAADRARGTHHSGDNAGKNPTADEAENSTPSDQGDRCERDGISGEEEIVNQPYAISGLDRNGESEHTSDGEKGDADTDKNNGNWFQQVATTLGITSPDDDQAKGDEADNTKSLIPSAPVSASIYQDAQTGSEQPMQVDTSDKSPAMVQSGTITESGVYFDATDTAIETERPKSPEAQPSPRTRFEKDHFMYQDFDPEEFAKWIGYAEETQCDELVDTLGVEQLTAYSREMSQSAANPCVNGCNEEALSLWSIEELGDMLEDAKDDVREANAELLRVRADIFRKENKLPKDHGKQRSDDDDDGTNDPKMLASVMEGEHDNGGSDDVEEGIPSNASHDSTGLRQRAVPSAHAKYNMAQSLVNQVRGVTSSMKENEKKNARCCDTSNLVCFAKPLDNTKKVVKVLDHPTFAVVTFTSRQSAISARQCLADGKATDRWSQIDAIPVPALADAPPCDIFFCRGCCRPVTLTISPRERKGRQVFVWAFYVFFCCLYSIPLAIVSTVLDPTYLATAFPDAEVWQNSDGVFFQLFAGISSGMLYSLFFSVLPQIFKYLAFMLGSASTIQKGEDNALKFYWYFMLVTAFTGSTLASILLQGLFQGNFSEEFQDGLTTIAQTIPTSQAPVWLNWIITRTFITLPMNYLFQFMTFLYGCLRFKWLNRVMRGGGPGGPPPYRINVDSGVVFMCITSLAPVAPLIAPFATLYYSVFIPMLRWLNIFVYRPKYDAGGIRFPIYHDIIISSLMLGQLLIGASILFKEAVVAGAVVIAMLFPTYFFSAWTKDSFERAYLDAGLLQTSKLDGWGVGKTIEGRERYRKWLIDAHKAAYVPLCLCGGEDFLTSQPAVTVPTFHDVSFAAAADEAFLDAEQGSSSSPASRPGLQRFQAESKRYLENTSQKGAVFKRYNMYS